MWIPTMIAVSRGREGCVPDAYLQLTATWDDPMGMRVEVTVDSLSPSVAGSLAFALSQGEMGPLELLACEWWMTG